MFVVGGAGGEKTMRSSYGLENIKVLENEILSFYLIIDAKPPAQT
jgi:hypothetical protein